MEANLDVFYSLPTSVDTPLDDSLLKILSLFTKAALIYNYLSAPNAEHSKTKLELAWETDLGCVRSIYLWDKIWTRTLKISRSASTTQSMFL